MARPTSLKTVVSRLFSASERPIYVLDPASRIVYCNAALAEWLDVDEEALPGKKCTYAGETEDNLYARLAVPPQALGQEEFRSTISIGEGKRASHRSALFLSLKDRVDLGSTLVMLAAVDCDPAEDSPFDALSLHQQLIDLRREWSQPFALDQLMGKSPQMRQVRSQVATAAASRCSVLIVGNAGTGRETVARTIQHEQGNGSERLVPLACDLLDADLVKANMQELVRHAAETVEDEPATLLLLEVDQLSPEAQASLPVFLEIPELCLRTLATSKVPLSELVEQGGFRPELAHLLTELEIRLPSLSDRLEDIPLLAQWMLEQTDVRDQVGGFSPEAIESLVRYPWPRELGELREVVEEAAAGRASSAATQGGLVLVSDLPKKIGYAADALALPDIEPEDISLDEFMGEVETELIRRALRNAKGNRAQAARSLDISRNKLLRRIDQLGIKEE